MLIGCKKITVDFTYTPAQPKAGEVVSFLNNSSAGENWAWDYGDNTTSQSKSPNKIYKKPGEYVVTLMVDSSKYQTHSKIIQIYDTIPTFVCSTDSILLYHDVTFTANIYNPFKHELTYEWTLPENCILQAGTKNKPQIVLYFTTPEETPVQLSIKQNNKTFDIQKTFQVHNTLAPSILMRTTDNTVLRQRIINERLEQVTAGTSEDTHRIEQTTDTIVRFNGVTFYASQMHTVFGHQVKRMQLDHTKQIWYITTENGIFATTFNGKYQKLIDANASGALYLDEDRQRIYWATHTGLYATPLLWAITNNDNHSAIPEQYNSINNIDLITVNNTPQ